ncbi:acetylcholinesterase-like [Argonauta hians]
MELLVVVIVLAHVMVTTGSEDRTYIFRHTKYGLIKGYVQTLLHGDRDVERYLGIPYAQPPVGQLRFENPKPPKRWGKKVLHALQLPPACLQSIHGMYYIKYYVPTFNKSSEDCLYLNIYRPKEEGNEELLPVNIYVHGGSYQAGAGCMMDGSFLAMEGVVVVTFNYRLGPMGFLSLPKYGITGNYGMLDQIALFRWVKENIRQFGGDPNRVTIDGHSAGAAAVGLQLLSPLAKGLFHRVIQQSGSPLAAWAVSDMANKSDFYDQLFLLSVHCTHNSTQNMKTCLQSLPTEMLKKKLSFDLSWYIYVLPSFAPVIDGYFLPDNPEKMLRSYPLNAHQFFAGTTRDEGYRFEYSLKNLNFKAGSMKSLLEIMSCLCGHLPGIGGNVAEVLQQYLPWPYDINNETAIRQMFSEVMGDYYFDAPTRQVVNILQERNVTVYIYHFSYLSALGHSKAIPHGSEIFYLSGAPLTGHVNFRYDSRDRAMSRYLIRLWATFVKQGLPSLMSYQNFYIDRYTLKKPIYALITNSQRGDPHIEIRSHFKPEKMEFWNKKVPEIQRRNFHLTKYEKIPYDRQRPRQTITPDPAWGLMTACIMLSVLVLVLAVMYCRTRHLVKRLLRQNRVASGTCMINHVN